MRHSFLLFVLLVTPSVTVAQAPVCSEQKIQAAVERASAKYSDDSFFWSGAFDKPLIGKSEEDAGRRKAEVDEPRKNQTGADHPQRIVVAKSGDMAYEYGRGSVSYEVQKTGKHVTFEVAYLRVWKSAGGECKVAAYMVKPIESTIQEK